MAGRFERSPWRLRLVWVSWLAVMAGANLATPLYSVYAARFGFSSLLLTLIFAAYAFVLVPSLLVFGRLSDSIGRRPVLLAGLGIACAGLACFAAAQSIGWLFAARALQGLGVGMISGPATAALVEFDPGGSPRRPALLAGLAQAGGSGLGPLLGGVLAEWAPAPRQLCFVLMVGATAAAAVFVWRLPEPTGTTREPWRIQWPRVPDAIRGQFALVSVTAGLSWAAAALYLSIGPSYARRLLGTNSLALLGAIAALTLAGSCVAQIVAQRHHTAPARGQAAGLLALAAGLVALALAARVPSIALVLAGAVTTGVGHGLGILSAQDELNEIAPDERRGEVTAAFICCIYSIVGVAVVGSGLLAEVLSLGAAVAVVTAILAVGAASTVVWQLATSGRGEREPGRPRGRITPAASR